IRLSVERLPGEAAPKPVWLWASTTGTDADTVDRWWQAFLRRFDIEHTFRMIKQTLGWTAPHVRHSEAADLWTWLIIAAHTQLRLARPLAEDLRRPWERPAKNEHLSPARVRRGFRNLRRKAARPAAAPKPSRPGPGRPPGSRNKHKTRPQPVGKTVKRAETIKEHKQRRG
ncbi:transposase, partial [Streptomyces sp. TM32]